MDISTIKNKLNNLADPEKAKILARFFKTGKGQYGEGDVFLGIKVPEIRKLVKKYKNQISLADTEKLLKSKFHEQRLLALLLFVQLYKNGDPEAKQNIYNFYLNNTKYINNWDLVDLTAEHIVGAYLEGKPKTILFELAKSNNLWKKRIAMLSTFYDIKKNKPQIAYEIAKILINDGHDLIQKAVGWMLRETGKRCSQIELEIFLKPRYKKMPRTMLRYAIERFPEKLRKKYLKEEI